MPPSRRYEEYPQLARLVRAMSDDGRELVAHWHRVVTTALEGYIPHSKREVGERMGQAARLGAGAGLEGWLTTMRKVAELVDAGGAGDWCCKRGMMADPRPCPQHDFDVRVLYDEGTIIERDYGHGKENAVYVRSDEVQNVWRSVQFPLTYSTVDIGKGRWRVVGRV